MTYPLPDAAQKRRAGGNYLSADRVTKIVKWLNKGLSLRAIAAALDVNRSTVLRYKKMLASGVDPIAFATLEPIEKRKPSSRLIVRLSRQTLERLEDMADQHDVSREELASLILETVARDDLFSAVIGEDSR